MRKWLRRALFALGGLVVLLVLVVIGIVVYVRMTFPRTYDRAVPQVTAPTDAATVARGEYIFKYTGLCWGCHGDEEDIDASPSGGFEFDLRKVGPPGGLGTFYARNLTPDVETGIGAWSDGEIVKALQQGLRPDGTVLMLMPFEWYRGMSQEDLLSVVAYMRSLEPVRNAVPDNRLSFTTKLLNVFKQITPQDPIDQPIVAPAPGPTVEYGEYLSSNISSCGECHTPLNLQNGRYYRDRAFTGGSIGFEDGGVKVYAPNLTGHPDSGLGTWTEGDFISALRTGVRPDGTVIMPLFMPWLVYRDLSDDDLKAIYRYLRTLPLEPEAVDPPEIAPKETGVERGRAVYRGYCSPCHGKDGTGTFMTTVSLRDADAATLESATRDGVPDTTMPGFAGTLGAENMAALQQFMQVWPEDED